MFELDYIMRILQNFFEDVAKIIHGKQRPNDEQQLEAFGDLYQNYLKNGRDEYYETSSERLIVSFNNDPDGIYKAEMLAILLYHDAFLQKDEAIRKVLLEKSLTLLRYLDAQSKVFSPERKKMIEAIELTV